MAHDVAEGEDYLQVGLRGAALGHAGFEGIDEFLVGTEALEICEDGDEVVSGWSQQRMGDSGDGGSI